MAWWLMPLVEVDVDLLIVLILAGESSASEDVDVSAGAVVASPSPSLLRIHYSSNILFCFILLSLVLFWLSYGFVVLSCCHHHSSLDVHRRILSSHLL